jgi:hypothetical protein
MWKCANPELERQIRCFSYGERSDVHAPASRTKSRRMAEESRTNFSIAIYFNRSWLWDLMPLSTLFQLYRGGSYKDITQIQNLMLHFKSKKYFGAFVVRIV